MPSRPSPTESANDNEYILKYGNDNNLWVSMPNKNFIYHWVKLNKLDILKSLYDKISIKDKNDYIPFLNVIDSDLNIKRLSEYKFCICPEGNGVDTHRLWECWYLKVIPIVIRTDFIDILMEKIKLPIIILNKWEDLIVIAPGDPQLKPRFLKHKKLLFGIRFLFCEVEHERLK